MNNINIESYGYTEFYQKQTEGLNINNRDLIPARIAEVHREQYKIITKFGEKNAKLKGSVFYNNVLNTVFPVVGDFALVKQNANGDDIIYKVLERKSKFSRIDTITEKEQIVAANFDYVFIMTSANNDFNIKRIERYLTASWQSGAMPIIIITKIDLCDDYETYVDELDNVAFGVPILPISSYTGEGLDELRNYLEPSKTIVLLGSSGVGKSTLVNLIAEKEIMKVNDIRTDDSKGRHTTTYRQLIMLKNGTMIIDTPGMRELGLWTVEDGLNTAFDDVEEYASQCKFIDCSHKSEPGCRVKEALENGELSVDRWKNYTKLLKEAKFAEKKEKINKRIKEKSVLKNKCKSKKSLRKDKIF